MSKFLPAILKKTFNLFIFNTLFFIFGNLAFAQTPYPIGTRNYTFTDNTQSSPSIPTVVYYPATSAGSNTPVATGTFPLIVFAHGAAMNSAAYTNIRDFLVPKGFIVAMPNTEATLSPAPNHGDFGKDIAVTATSMQAENLLNTSAFYNKITNKTALIGHSMGGGSTILAAQNNTNITTTVTLAAAETSPSSIAAAANVSVPSLVVAAQNECVLTFNGGTNAPPLIYSGLASTCKAFVEIKDGTHCNFTNGDGQSPFGDPAFNCYFGEATAGCSNINGLATQQARMEAVVLPWLNFWLKGVCSDYTNFNTTATNTSNYSDYLISCNYTLPAPTIQLNNTSPCVGTTETLTVANGTFLAYAWNNGATTTTINVSNSGNYNVTVTDEFGCAGSAQRTVTFANCSALFSGKVYLEGAWNGTAMNNFLQNNLQLPINQPFNTVPFNYAGAEQVSNVLSFPANVVDWVLLEIINAATNTVLAQKAVLLQTDGTLIDTNGGANIALPSAVANIEVHVKVRHRNHLAIQTQNPILLNTLTATNHDFTDPNKVARGNTQLKNGAMLAGDCNADGVISYHDYNIIATTNQSVGYFAGDCNLNGTVEGSTSDFTLYHQNASAIGFFNIRY